MTTPPHLDPAAGNSGDQRPWRFTTEFARREAYVACQQDRTPSGSPAPVTFCKGCPVVGRCLDLAVLHDDRWGHPIGKSVDRGEPEQLPYAEEQSGRGHRTGRHTDR